MESFELSARGRRLGRLGHSLTVTVWSGDGGADHI
jgi:hypothetical protein